jgi:hypothetical protein
MDDPAKSTVKKRGGAPPFVKGDPRICKHPPGRPPAIRCIADILRRIGHEKAPEALQEAMRKAFGLTKPITMEEAALRRVYIDACKGDMKAVEFIANRTEGASVQRIMNEGDQPFVVMLPGPATPELPAALIASPPVEPGAMVAIADPNAPPPEITQEAPK